MKKVSLLFLCLLLLGSELLVAQTTVTLGTGTTANAATGTLAYPTPYSTRYLNLRTQYLILASELNSLGLTGPNMIDALGFNVLLVNACAAMPNYSVKLKNTQATVLTTSLDNNYYTEVWTHPNFQPVNGWNTHTFTTPFLWDGVSNLLIDLCFSTAPAFTESASVYFTPTATSLTSYFRSDEEAACGTTSPATVSPNRANMQITYQPASGCLAPTLLPATSITPVSAQISWIALNGESLWSLKYGEPGFDPITEGTMINGITSSTYTLSGLTHLTLYDVYVKADCGADAESAWSNPIGFRTITDPLSGTYTINSTLATGGTNFNNFTDFALSMNLGGFGGPITIDVVPGTGPYNDQFILGTPINNTAGNSLIINGNGETLQYLSTNVNERATLKLNGTDYVTVNNLIIKALGSLPGEFGFAVHLMNLADYNTFNNCHFIADLNSVTTNFAAFATSNNHQGATSVGLCVNYLTIDQCKAVGGFYGIVVNGPSAAPFGTGCVVKDTEILDFASYGLYIRGQNNGLFSGNTLSRPSRVVLSTTYMVYLAQNVNNTIINGNRLMDFAGNSNTVNFGYGIYGTTLSAALGQELLISNNIISGFQGMNALGCGIYLSTASGAGNVRIFHNSIALDNTSHTGNQTQYGIYLTGATARPDIRNNIISVTTNSTGNKYCLYFNTNTAVVTSNNNVLHRGSTVGNNYTGLWSAVAYATLDNWKTANGGIYDQLSSDADPLFTNILGGDLNPQNAAVDNMGTNLLTFVPKDFYGVNRTATPDPGAIEFVPADCISPRNLAAGNFTISTAELTWLAGGTESLWNLEWGQAGFIQGSGTLVTGLTSTSLTLQNLDPATWYDFYVQAECSQTMKSAWAGPMSFTTLCETFEIPFTESFEVPGFPPDCWTRAYIAGTGSGLWDWMASGVTPTCLPHSGSGMAQYNSYSFAAGTKGFISTPGIYMESENLSVSFWIYRDVNYPASPDKVNVYYHTTPGVTGATLLGTVNRTIYLPPEVGAEGWYEYTFVPPAGVTGQTGYFIFEGESGFGYNTYIDDVKVSTASLGYVEGYVYKAASTIPIEGALVNFGQYTTTTNASGFYSVEEVLPGTYNMTASASGYNSQTIPNVSIAQGVNTVQNFELTFANILVQPEEINLTLNPAETVIVPVTISNAGGTAPLFWISSLEIPADNSAGSGNVSFEIFESEKSSQPAQVDQSPEAAIMKGDLTDATWSIEATWSTKAAGEQAIATDGINIYTAKWNTAGAFSKYDLNGNWIEDFTIPAVTAGIRDFAWDGAYFYGGAAATTVYKLDLVNKTLVTSFTSPVAVRHCSYDSHSNGFWVGDFTSLRLINSSGTTLVTGPALVSVYGSAYDPFTEGGPYLWFFSQVGTAGCGNAAYDLVTIQQFNIANLSFTGVVHCATDLPGYIPGNATTQTVAGGAEATEDLVPGKFVLMVNLQQSPNLVGVYELVSTIDWISLSPSSGTVEAGESVVMNAAIDVNGYENATLNCQIVITSNGFPQNKGDVMIPVNVIVNPEVLPPVAPYDPLPANNATMVEFQPVLSWTNGARTSEVRVTISKGLSSVYTSPYFKGNSIDLSTIPLTLDPMSVYRWRVEARNLAGNTLGPQWQFTTIGLGTVAGIITDSFYNTGIAGATVSVDPASTYSTVTGPGGAYSISGILEGQYLVTASHPDYNPAPAVPVTVVHNQTVTANISLSKYLAPPTDFSADLLENKTVHLTWKAPLEFPEKNQGKSAVRTIPENGDYIFDPNASDEGATGKMFDYSVPSKPFYNTGKGVLYDNGPLVSGACASTQAPESSVQAPTTSFGINNNKAAGYSAADNFIIPTGTSWIIQSLEFFAYQTGSGITPTITGIYIRVWNGSPMSGGTVVWGDLMTNLLTSSSFTGIFRVSSTTSCNTDRPVMKVIATTPGLNLSPGEYWIEFSTTGSVASGPWIPIVFETNGSFAGNNALQYTPANGWTLYASGGVNVEWPFIINGVPGTGTIPENLLGFKIYRNNSQIEFVPVTSNPDYEYSDGPLNYGNYDYKISAVYVEGESEPTATIPVEILPPQQTVVLPLGWSGWSSFIDPLTAASFADVIAPVAPYMDFGQYFGSIYWPAYGINTLGDFSNDHGYVARMNAAAEFTLQGNLLAPGIINLNAGWNLISILSECDVDVSLLGTINGFVICMEVAGSGVYWPAGGITTLTNLVPGKAYWVKSAAGTFTFPACAKNASVSVQLPVRKEYTAPWNTVNYTAVTHFIAISEEAGRVLAKDDMIGAFNTAGICTGITQYEGKATSLNIFGDDVTTTAPDGMTDGSNLIFKVFRATTGEIFDVTVNYGIDMPDYNGTFTTLGMSRISGMTLHATGVGTHLSGVFVFPNPSTGYFNITINGVSGNVDITVMDVHGQTVVNTQAMGNTMIDLSGHPRGIYYVKLIGDNFSSIEKVVVK